MPDHNERTYLVDNPQFRSAAVNGFMERVPHSKHLGLEVVSIERNKAVLRVPYKEELLGHVASGIIHGGVILSLMDALGGMATFCGLPALEVIATLDLRVDYMKPAVAGKTIFASGECYKLTNTIVFVRGIAYQDDPDDPVAACMATFMRSSSNVEIGAIK